MQCGCAQVSACEHVDAVACIYGPAERHVRLCKGNASALQVSAGACGMHPLERWMQLEGIALQQRSHSGKHTGQYQICMPGTGAVALSTGVKDPKIVGAIEHTKSIQNSAVAPTMPQSQHRPCGYSRRPSPSLPTKTNGQRHSNMWTVRGTPKGREFRGGSRPDRLTYPAPARGWSEVK